MKLKKCSKCKVEKQETDFWKNAGNGTIDGLHSWCKKCLRSDAKARYHKTKKNDPEKLKKYARDWFEKNRERSYFLSKRSYEKRRYETLCAYGGIPPRCSCCKEKEIKFLSFDHIKGGGLKHAREIKTSLMLWLRRNNYPKGFQILCHNCNFAKGHYGKCPHKKGGN